METKKICIKEVNENLRLIKLGEPLTRSLKELNCIICKNKFKQRYHNQVCCSKKCSKDKIKAYYEAYYEANKDKIKAYYEANKDTRTKQQRMRDAWEKSEHDMSKLQGSVKLSGGKLAVK